MNDGWNDYGYQYDPFAGEQAVRANLRLSLYDAIADQFGRSLSNEALWAWLDGAS